MAIARALVNHSKILFADEPCANLDTRNSEIVMKLLRQLCDERRQTIVMVTHEPEHRQYMDRIVWIKDGVIDREENAVSNYGMHLYLANNCDLMIIALIKSLPRW